MRHLLLITLMVFGSLCSTAIADVPGKMSLQGRLVDSTGMPIDTTVDITFRLYNDKFGTSLIWQEVQPNVRVNDGVFDVRLGKVVPLTPTVFDGTVRYLSVQVGSGDESNASIEIVSSAYAQRAGHADTAAFALGTTNNGWVDNGGVIHPETLTDSVGIGTDDPISRLDVVAPLLAIVGRTEGDNFLSVGVYGYSDQGGTGVLGQSADGRGVYGSSANAFAGYFDGPKSYFSDRVGIGTTNPQRDLDVRGDSIVIYGRTSGSGTSAGVMGVSTGTGTGVSGSSSTGYGGHFDGGLGIGVFGTSSGLSATHFICSSGTAVYGTSNTGYGGYFQAPKNYFSGKVGIGAPAPNHELHARGSGVVVYGETDGSGTSAGVKGKSTGPGRGVFGDSESGIGVYGNSNTGYGGYFRGPEHYFNGLLGLGTFNPTHRLSVDGSVAFQSADDTKYHVTYYNGGLNFSETSVADYRINIEDGGNVGIGTGNPQEKLHVAGNAKINGTLTAGDFAPDAINHTNIVDEVGIASTGSSSGASLTTTWSAYLTRQITVPAAGKVLAVGFARFWVDHGISGSSWARMGISSVSDDIDGGHESGFYLGSCTDACIYQHSASCQRLFNCPSAGTYTYYMVARDGEDNEVHILHRHLDLLFIPTVYASTAGTVLSDARDDAVRVAEVEAAAAESPASERQDVLAQMTLDDSRGDRDETDLDRILAELETLREEVAALKSQRATKP